jgi:protein-L-isoaspartate(D-aspartate) O-methyltransferase
VADPYRGCIRLHQNTADGHRSMVMQDLSEARAHMVESQLVGRGIHDSRVLKAMQQVPREAFVESGYEDFAYDDSPLPIGEGQTISQPYIVAFMIEATGVAPGDVALDVGTGSGYAAAVMGQIAEHVYTIERHASLARQAEQRFAALGYDNIHVRIGDGSRGWPDAGPYDAILVAAGAPRVPLALREQLTPGGRLVIPVGGYLGSQRLLRVRRADGAGYEEEPLAAVRFVPLIGEQGWDESKPL